MSKSSCTRRDDKLKQRLDEDLSQLLDEYSSRGLSSDEIVDSVLWHAEVVATEVDRKRPVREQVTL